MDQLIADGVAEAVAQLIAHLVCQRCGWQGLCIAGILSILERLPFLLQLKREVLQAVGGDRKQPGRITGQGRLGDITARQINDRGFDAVAVTPAVMSGIRGNFSGKKLEGAEINQLAGHGQAAGFHHAEGGAGTDPLAQQR